MDELKCPHCTALAFPEQNFCTRCGFAVRSPIRGEHIARSDLARAHTAAGQQFQVQGLFQRARSASHVLLFLAVLFALFAAFVGVVLDALPVPRRYLDGVARAGVLLFGFSASMFFALWGWSRVSPLPASLVGAVIVATLGAGDLVVVIQQGHSAVSIVCRLIALLIVSFCLFRAANFALRCELLRAEVSGRSSGATR